MKFTDQVFRQFGPYRKRCAELICDSAKAGLAAVPDQIHHLEFATIQDLQCIANGDEFCEWEFRWPPQTLRDHLFWPVAALVTGSATFGYLRGAHPDFLLAEALVLALFPAVACWFAGHLNRLQKKMTTREELIKEQVLFVETRHEELREAYLEQERTFVELRRKVDPLTTLHRAGLLFISTLDRSQEYALTQDDLSVMATVANQVATALDNAQIYHQTEELNVGLEKRVQERTMELQAANEKL
ncbi:MAG: hypothetical protein ACE10C_12765 [Candidatus Binatia bacterium]